MLLLDNFPLQVPIAYKALTCSLPCNHYIMIRILYEWITQYVATWDQCLMNKCYTMISMPSWLVAEALLVPCSLPPSPCPLHYLTTYLRWSNVECYLDSCNVWAVISAHQCLTTPECPLIAISRPLCWSWVIIMIPGAHLLFAIVLRFVSEENLYLRGPNHASVSTQNQQIQLPSYSISYESSTTLSLICVFFRIIITA